MFIYLSLLASVLENKYISEQEISNALSKKKTKKRQEQQNNQTKHKSPVISSLTGESPQCDDQWVDRPSTAVMEITLAW